jgi:hypothetical protein
LAAVNPQLVAQLLPEALAFDHATAHEVASGAPAPVAQVRVGARFQELSRRLNVPLPSRHVKGRHAVEARVPDVWFGARRQELSHDFGFSETHGRPESRATPIASNLDILPLA